MTVEELIEELRAMPLTAVVVVRDASIEAVVYAHGEAIIQIEEDEDDNE